MLLLDLLFALAIAVNVCSAIYWWRLTGKVRQERDQVLQQRLTYLATQAQIARVLADVELADRWLTAECQRMAIVSYESQGAQERRH